MSQFRFSPRPNRAHEIPWMAWESQAFARAERESKPILLAISAVWCHWCHVMDETTYSDPGVIDAIRRQFVPVRVDNDERPDINARYNMGGWPTTAFLAADGTTLTGGTYVPPEPMRNILDEVARWYRDNAAEIARRGTEMKERRLQPEPAAPADLAIDGVRRLTESIAQTYDPEYGGFGEAPKFPQPELLEFLLREYEATGQARLREMAVRTLEAMATGGMYDRVEGGLFRYSTTRDWSVPHFEKMTEDNAGIMRAISLVLRQTPESDLRRTLRSTVDYVLNVLRDPEAGTFAGSQDADEAYYALSLDERRVRKAPYVDRTLYSDRNAAIAGALCLAGSVLGDESVVAKGLRAIDVLHDRMGDGDGLLLHVHREGDRPVGGLLCDQTSYLRALIEAHGVTGECRLLERATATADAMQRRLGASDGGFYDRAPSQEQLGRLKLQDKPIADNAIAAESLLRLWELCGENRYRALAQSTLLVYARTFERAGAFAAAYARALRRFLSSADQDRRTNAFQYQQPQNPTSME